MIQAGKLAAIPTPSKAVATVFCAMACSALSGSTKVSNWDSSHEERVNECTTTSERRDADRILPDFLEKSSDRPTICIALSAGILLLASNDFARLRGNE